MGRLYDDFCFALVLNDCLNDEFYDECILNYSKYKKIKYNKKRKYLCIDKLLWYFTINIKILC